MATFGEKERYCQTSFNSGGPYWHLYTSGKNTGLIFKTKEDYVYAMNVMAQVALIFPKLHIVTFAIMDNHVHILISGPQDEVIRFFNFFRKKLTRGLNDGLPKTFIPFLKEITDLKMIRNEIAYINRNGYTPNPAYTPFSYPWGANVYYYNCSFSGNIIGSLTFREVRKLLKSRALNIPPEWQIFDGYIMPISYCAIKFGMAMFRDAHHYFKAISKDVEAYHGVAEEIGDGEYLSDEEVFDIVQKILRENYNGVQIGKISKAQKEDVARTLHYECHSSNGQISRLLYMSLYDVDRLFPMPKIK